MSLFLFSVGSSNVTQPASEGNAPASGNHNEILSTGGRLPPTQEGTTPVTSHGGRTPSVGGGPLPLSASGGNAPACGEVEDAGPYARQTREEGVDYHAKMTNAAREDFERSDGRWIIHPRSGERLWVRNREIDSNQEALARRAPRKPPFYSC